MPSTTKVLDHPALDAECGATPLVLVSDRFKAQLPDPRLVSVTELLSLITWLTAHRETVAPIVLLAGQGLNDGTVNDVCRLIAENGLDGQLLISPVLREPRAGFELTHKRQPHNVVISAPTEIGAHTYRAWLQLDDHSDDIRDHLTGAHLPGMIIVEAARQMVLAVSEAFIISEGGRGRLSFVTHSKTFEFSEFMFPLPVEIHCSVDKLRCSGPVNFKASMTIRFVQNQISCVVAKFVFSAFNHQIFSEEEERIAARAVKTMLGFWKAREIKTQGAVRAHEELAK